MLPMPRVGIAVDAGIVGVDISSSLFHLRHGSVHELLLFLYGCL